MYHVEMNLKEINKNKQSQKQNNNKAPTIEQVMLLYSPKPSTEIPKSFAHSSMSLNTSFVTSNDMVRAR